MADPQSSAQVDTAVLDAAATGFDLLSRTLDARAAWSRLAFGATTAGRSHVGAGQSLRQALDPLAAAMAGWERAAAGIAAVLRSGSQRYRAGESDAAALIGSG
ncbi:type VII secretion target [Mycolicibacterium brumae]|uniref:ESX-1 secretion-associated protein n=1 Tax=Mycolicibacterium brumae TaxID=85968 RepID=A0A2G5PHC5_9MYCO|nr:type VII secretion target [Mycolicibacterium brumae]MCV7194481.1 hypothetical protein [Mycolicibacterium brumae]PIB77708.1 hypothetical protein CQY22_001885 [Mycolicibacterium brumae]UWW10016.1 type VII secretion target [Mycolicibacterium brumae]